MRERKKALDTPCGVYLTPVSYTHLDVYKRQEPYVVIAAGDGVYKLDYNKVLEYHIEKKADITVVCKDMEMCIRDRPRAVWIKKSAQQTMPRLSTFCVKKFICCLLYTSRCV